MKIRKKMQEGINNEDLNIDSNVSYDEHNATEISSMVAQYTIEKIRDNYFICSDKDGNGVEINKDDFNKNFIIGNKICVSRA